MISRYSRKEMEWIWTAEFRFKQLLKVETEVALVQSEMGIIPKEAAENIRKKGSFSVERILEIEQTTKHDVIAFVSNVAENVGPDGRYVHFGLTSSDVLDTAMSLVVHEAAQVLKTGLDRWEKALESLVQKYQSTLCSGRTHGMHAEPTTFGFKMAGYLAELRRNRSRFDQAIEQFRIVKLSGPVGTYSNGMKAVERSVGEKLGLVPETIATQVIPRDRHAEVLFALGMLGAGMERLATELRHLQRTEVGEVTEGFDKGQKGSSAMPHKKNPISGENLTGLARLLRSYLTPALENIALWHERDISHSSVERVIFPDAFLLADYACHRIAALLEKLEVNSEQMIANMELSHGQMFSSQLLLALVAGGLSREEGYKLVQALSHGLGPNENLKNKALVSSEILKHVRAQEIEQIFSGKRHLAHVPEMLRDLLS